MKREQIVEGDETTQLEEERGLYRITYKKIRSLQYRKKKQSFRTGQKFRLDTLKEWGIEGLWLS